MKGNAILYSVRIGERIITLLMSLNSFQSSSLKKGAKWSSRNCNVQSLCSEKRLQIKQIKGSIHPREFTFPGKSRGDLKAGPARNI
uniref:Uncharacterized protein n=1 Tax=Meloidogyne incognita TaxID=6306 RepID=A0A914LYZ6_MELIC